jgi:hypothetical protein
MLPYQLTINKQKPRQQLCLAMASLLRTLIPETSCTNDASVNYEPLQQCFKLTTATSLWFVYFLNANCTSGYKDSFQLPVHCPFLTNLHALKNIGTLPLQLATARHVCCNGHATTNIPTANWSASHPCSTLCVVILLVRVQLLDRGGMGLQQPTLVVNQGLSVVSSVKFKQPKGTSY